MESADLFVIDNEAEGEAETCVNEKEKEESGNADAGMSTSTSSARSGRRYREGDQRIQQVCNSFLRTLDNEMLITIYSIF